MKKIMRKLRKYWLLFDSGDQNELYKYSSKALQSKKKRLYTDVKDY